MPILHLETVDLENRKEEIFRWKVGGGCMDGGWRVCGGCVDGGWGWRTDPYKHTHIIHIFY